MSGPVFAIDGVLWVWPARRETWVFVSLGEGNSADVRDIADGRTGGFGSVPVRARIGTTVWRTSVFPEKSSGAFVLPLKQAVRRAEGLEIGGRARGDIELLL